MKKSCFLMVVLCLFTWVSSAWADATVESYTKFGGFKGTGAYEGTTTMRIQGDKQSDASSIKFTGAILSWAAGGSDTVNITRLDKGIEWSLNPKKKTYTETAITPFKPEKEGKAAKEDKAEKPTVRVSKSEFKVKKTGASERINGFPCEEYLLTWLLVLENIETKEKTSNTMTTNLWTTPETASIKKLQAEEMAFAKAYMKKMGISMKPDEMKQYGMSVFATMSGASEKELEKGFASFKKEMGKVKGFPIRTIVSWKVEGGQIAQAKQQANTETSPSYDVSGGIGGFLSSAIGNKVKSSVKPEESAPFFSSTIEVKSISTDPIAGDAFDIPAGYKLSK